MYLEDQLQGQLPGHTELRKENRSPSYIYQSLSRSFVSHRRGTAGSVDSQS